MSVKRPTQAAWNKVTFTKYVMMTTTTTMMMVSNYVLEEYSCELTLVKKVRRTSMTDELLQCLGEYWAPRSEYPGPGPHPILIE